MVLEVVPVKVSCVRWMFVAKHRDDAALVPLIQSQLDSLYFMVGNGWELSTDFKHPTIK